MKSRIVLAGAALAMLLISNSARAELTPGMVRLHLDTTLLEFGTGEQDWDGDNNDRNYDGFEVGIGTPGMGIGIGGTLGKGFVLGGKVTLARASADWYMADDSEAFVWSLVPYLEYVFLTGVARPFIMGQLGFEGAHDSTDNNDYGWWSMVFGIGGGCHFFVADKLSLDAALQLQQRFGTGQDDPDGAAETEFSHWRFSAAILFGLSAWF